MQDNELYKGCLLQYKSEFGIVYIRENFTSRKWLHKLIPGTFKVGDYLTLISICDEFDVALCLMGNDIIRVRSIFLREPSIFELISKQTYEKEQNV